MPFSFLFKRRKHKPPAVAKPMQIRPASPLVTQTPIPQAPISGDPTSDLSEAVLRYFFNLKGSQTYASFFRCWDGFITAGHVMSDTNYTAPPFVPKDKAENIQAWPDGLDAAIIGCTVPRECPAPPRAGQAVICLGYPAGSRHVETRTATVYMPRPAAQGVWIARILSPDEPVVTGMSGGPVLDAKTKTPIGIIITRNSPADLNADRDPDESLDFVSLAGLWRALHAQKTFV